MNFLITFVLYKYCIPENVMENVKSYIEQIKELGKPVCVYGMGNGAEKIIAHLEKHGIRRSCVFASDGFVRGQSFLGGRVRSLSEAEEEFGDFTVVTAFALEGGKCDIFYDLASRHTLFAPNLPPYGENCINAGWIKENEEKINEVYAHLADETSKKVFSSLLGYNVSGDIRSIFHDFTPPEGWYERGGVHADVGAYDGDTALIFAENCPSYEKIYAFEPSPKTFAKLEKNVSGLRDVVCVNAAVGERDGKGYFDSKKGRGSSLSASGSEINVVSLDSFFASGRLDSVKIDGEGEDMEILRGGVNVFFENKTNICAAVYHRAYDLVDIPLWLSRQMPGCALYLRNKKYVPAFDVFVYAVNQNHT